MKRIYRRVIAVVGSKGRYHLTLECGHTLSWQPHCDFHRKHCWHCAGIRGVLVRRREAQRLLTERIRQVLLSPQGQQDWVESELEGARRSAAEQELRQLTEFIDQLTEQFQLTPRPRAIGGHVERVCLLADEEFWKMSLFSLAEEWVKFFGGTAIPVRDENDDEVGLDVNCGSPWLEWKVRRYYRPEPVVLEEARTVPAEC